MDATSTDFDLVTKVKFLPITCKWVIENFDNFFRYYPRDNHEQNKIESAPFRLSNSAATKGVFSLAHYTDSIHVYVKVSLQVHSSFEKPVKFGYKLEFLGSSDSYFGIKILSDSTSSASLCFWSEKDFKSKNYVKDGELAMVIHLTFHDVSNSVSCKKKSAINPSDVPAQEANGFGCILGDKEFSDVTFIAGDQEIPAHKALLAAKSPVFAAMFKSKMKEEQTNRIEITEEVAVFEELLRFIYTGNVENLDNNTEDLFVASDKYGIDQLKMLCEIELIENLNAGNAVQRLVLADLHGTANLKCEAIDLINSNAEEVSKTLGWKALIETKPHLLAEIYGKVMNI
jgi:BTB/POZ domain